MELIYLRSPTGLQHQRALEILAKVREARPDVTIREVDPSEDPALAERFKIKYSPGLIINGRIEFVGIPREGMLLERLELISQGLAEVGPPVAPPTAKVQAASSQGKPSMGEEERKRRIEEAKRKAEEVKRQREGQGKG
jgi:hypothetical protein